MAVSSQTPNIPQIHLSDSFSSWYYGIYVITIGVGLIISFFLAFETRFNRPPTTIDGQLLFTDDFGNIRILSDTEAQAHLAELERLLRIFPERHIANSSIHGLERLPTEGESSFVLTFTWRRFLLLQDCCMYFLLLLSCLVNLCIPSIVSSLYNNILQVVRSGFR
jgi:hypothetical protein